MARLPIPGQDDGTWGDILNDYLSQSLDSGGGLKSSSLTAAGGVTTINGKTANSGAVNLGLADLTDVNGASSASNNQVLAWSSVSNKWIPSTVSSTTVNDASTTNKGIVQLAGDLAGTATAPVVAAGAIDNSKISSSAGIARTKLDSSTTTSLGKADTAVQQVNSKSGTSVTLTAGDVGAVATTGNETIAGVKTFSSAPVVPANAFPESAVNNLTTDLASKATDSTVVHNTGSENIAGVKTFTSAPVVPSSSFPESAVTNLTSDLGTKATDTAVVHNTGAETIAGVKTFSSSPIIPTPGTTTAAANKQYVDSAVSSGAPNATTGAPGLVQLTGDLNNTATNPEVTSTHLTSPLPTNQGGTGSATQNFVDLTTPQTVAGVKTFSSAPVVPSGSFPESAVTNLTSDLAGKQASLGFTPENVANKDTANGYAGLDANTLLKVTEMPRALGVIVDLGTNNTGTVTCNLSLGIAFKVVLTTNTTISFTNWPSSGLAEPEVYTIQDATGGHTISLPSVTWEPTGSPPTFNTGANAVNIIPVASFDAGTTIYGITGLQGPAGTNGAAGPGICTFSMSGSLSTSPSTGSRQYFESSFTIDKVRASVGTSPAGSSITIDVIKNNGSSILSSPLSITAGTNTATTTSFASSSLTSGDYLTVTVTAVGSSTAGADLAVTVTVH